MKRIKLKAAILLCLCSLNSLADEYLLVVTNCAEIDELSKTQLRQLYLENGINYPAKPLSLTPGSKLRAIFNTKIIGLTESRIQSYWAQMRFTGRAEAPIEFETVEELVQFMKSNPDYVGYLPSEYELPPSFKVVQKVIY